MRKRVEIARKFSNKLLTEKLTKRSTQGYRMLGIEGCEMLKYPNFSLMNMFKQGKKLREHETFLLI